MTDYKIQIEIVGKTPNLVQVFGRANWFINELGDIGSLLSSKVIVGESDGEEEK